MTDPFPPYTPDPTWRAAWTPEAVEVVERLERERAQARQLRGDKMPDYTELVVILDRSGSMQDRKADHEGGLKSFVEDQKKLAGDVRFTLIQFDSNNPCEVVYDGVPIDKVGAIQLVPRGGTPLLDAVGKSIAHVQGRIKDAKPDQVVVMVVTDGEENSSREWTKQRVSERVKELEKQGWHFLFLAANIDAFAEAGSMGIGAQTVSGYANSHVGTQWVYANLSRKVASNRVMLSNARTGGQSLNDVTLDYAFTESERFAMNADDDTGGLVGTVLGGSDIAANTQGKGRGRRGRNRSGSTAGGNGA